MPIGKKSAADSTLYALIAFVALFIIAATAGVIYYLKFEEQRGLADTAQKRLGEFASPAEVQKIGALVGAEQSGKSRLKVTLDYLDQTLSLIVPGVPGETSAEVKVNEATAKVKEMVAGIGKQYPELNDIDSNSALLQVTEKLTAALQSASTAETAARGQLEELQNKFDDATKASMEKEQALLAEKDKFQQQFEKVRSGYDELKGLLEKKTDEQVKDLYGKLDQERTGREETNKQLLKSQAELQIAQDRIQKILKESVWPIKPPPETMVKAFEPDGKVILVDDQAKTVQINLGGNDHIYRGLTFAVYDRGQPIPRDGKGKAEIEVYNVGDSFSAARIIRSDKKNPVVVDDIIANLIWSPTKANTFVVAGDFDLNGDGVSDDDAIAKIRRLVEKWGGKVADSVTVNTDYVILGTPPEVPSKPTMQETEKYPNAMEKYERTLQQAAKYKDIQSQAQALSIPILNADRFLYFIGYKTQAGNPGAF
ncbi:MAG: BRCT domain-containing protein [Sedimentisphaerales bacterium]